MPILREFGDRLGDVADLVNERRLESLLREEGADRVEHELGVGFVELADHVLADERGRAVRDGEDAVDDGVAVFRAEPLVVGGEVGEHALGVGAAVDGNQDLHGASAGRFKVSRGAPCRR